MGIRGSAILGACLIALRLLAQNASISSSNLSVASLTNSVLETHGTTSKVLALNGTRNYLDLPREACRGLNVATLECRVKWHTFAGNEHVFEFDAAKRVKVGNRANQPDVEFIAAGPPAAAQPQPPAAGPDSNLSPFEFEKHEAAATSQESSDSMVGAGMLTLERWHHLALVVDAEGTSLYLDGSRVGTAPYTKGFASVTNTARHFVGSCSLYPQNSFHGEIDEVRLWRVARTVDQNRESMGRSLTRSEEGVVGLWNFDDPANPGRDASPNGNSARLVGAPVVAPSATPVARASAIPVV